MYFFYLIEQKHAIKSLTPFESCAIGNNINLLLYREGQIDKMVFPHQKMV